MCGAVPARVAAASVRGPGKLQAVLLGHAEHVQLRRLPEDLRGSVQAGAADERAELSKQIVAVVFLG